MKSRLPAVAGQFYPAAEKQCIEQIRQCIPRVPLENIDAGISCGIVPHAGWTFSGQGAAVVFAAIKKSCPDIDTFIIFGAVHRYPGSKPAVYPQGCWLTPLGEVEIDTETADQITDTGTAEGNAAAHSGEHSIEVQLPFIKYMFPKAQIVPIGVPPCQAALELGRAVGSIIMSSQKKIAAAASTDLTHYGPGYGFSPAGDGPGGIKWAFEVNDRIFIDSALRLDAAGLLAGSIENFSACGPGAAAALVAAAKTMGKTSGKLLLHTNSNKIMIEKMGHTSTESVGYASIVF